MKSRKQGFTIVELLVVSLASSVLALTAGLMLMISYRAWISNGKYVDLQRDISLTQTIADKWVREAAHWDVAATNDELVIVTPTATRRLYSDSGSLFFDPDTSSPGDELTVSSNRVTEFVVEATAFGVNLDLRLKEDAMDAELHTFIGYRN